MPPAESLHQLSERDKMIFKRWMEQGSKYEQHWACVAPKKAPLPDLQDMADVRHPVDRIILAAMEGRAQG